MITVRSAKKKVKYKATVRYHVQIISMETGFGAESEFEQIHIFHTFCKIVLDKLGKKDYNLHNIIISQEVKL